MLRSLILIAVFSSLAGLVAGWFKGQPRMGFWLGLLGGPLGVGLMVMLPARGRPPEGPRCPRCRKPVGVEDKACTYCGNVLVPIHYEVKSGS